MKILRTVGASTDETREVIAKLEARGATNTAKVDAVVRAIVDGVRERGDAGVREVSAKFDGLTADDSLLVSLEEMQA
ncbi:MAG: histidinol dehydrogenase, partial [Bryocella sp.]